jgi:hypothetical protein
MREAWCYGCGSCGRDIVLRADLIIESRSKESAKDPCDDCQETIQTGIDFNEDNLVLTAVNRLMGFCPCGEPELITTAVMRYMASPKPIVYGEPFHDLGEMGFQLIAYIANAIGWTEHGGAVTASWPTDMGYEALKHWQTMSQAQPLSLPQHQAP